MARAAKHVDRRTKASRKARKAHARSGHVRDRSSRQEGQGSIPAKISDGRVGFLDLPLELRAVVYEHALRKTDGHTIPLNLAAHLGVTKELAFGLLGTCRMIRKEATGIIYGHNTFRVDIIPTLNSTLPPTAQIRQERMESENDNRVYTETELKDWWKGEVATPQLSRALRLISPARLVSVKSFIFAFHARRLDSTESYKNIDFSRTPELTVKLDFSEQQPRCQIALDRGKDFQTIFATTGTALSIISYLTDSIESRNLRALSRNDVRDFALWISYQCERDLKCHHLLDV